MRKRFAFCVADGLDSEMRRLLLLLVLPFVVHAMPESPLVLPLWEGTPPNAKKSNQTEKVNDDGRVKAVARVQSPTIEVRLPSRANATGKAMVVCPGGGYGVVVYDWEGTDIAAALNAKGIAAIILKYRLPENASNVEPYLSPLMDAKRAMRLTRFHANDWGIDPNQIGVMGFSAGGHLASTLGTRFDDGDDSASDAVERLSSRPDFMVLVYPVISMKEEVTHGGSRKNLIGSNPSQELEAEYSNELQVTENTPPTFIVHSGDDGGVPVENSLLFYQALRKAGVDTEMHLYPYGGHGYSLAIGQGRLQKWMDLCLDWVADQ